MQTSLTLQERELTAAARARDALQLQTPDLSPEFTSRAQLSRDWVVKFNAHGPEG